ncbi:hypothetical protein WICPIJ_008801 [Wickerhamomyces pijperi]|uniref:Major facilitator superfamily (MFS) profile domain-containing protein n=1 Tax=Wickerhamomyces pijperi TaxID=599730 RepID=A0A9P8THD5_WICPI|nr:hypothetical protein WICPIJ_008801 [Wickerhamomyces pijperi]
MGTINNKSGRTTTVSTYELDQVQGHSQAQLNPFQTNHSAKPESIRELSNLNEEETTAKDEIIYPEGGLQAYLVVFGSFMGLIPAFGLINSIGAIESYVSTHQLSQVSTSTISWIFSLFTFMSSAAGIFSGAFFDRQGAFYPLCIGTVLFCGGLIGTANCTTVAQFIMVFGVICGLGNGMLISPLVGVVAHYFDRKRATYSSVATTGGSVGGIIFPLILKKLYPAVGFAWAMRALGFICLGLLTIAITFAKARKFNTEEPKEKMTWKQFIRTYFLDVFDYRGFKETKFTFCALGVCLSESSLIVSSIYFPSYAIKRGFSESTSYLLITVVNSTGILGRYIPGYLADKFVGRFNIVILMLLGCAACSLILWLPFGYSLPILYVYAALYGFFSGAILSLPPVCCGQISKTEEFGKRYATTYLITSCGFIAMIPVGGVIVDKGQISNYNGFIGFVAALALSGAACYAISRSSVVGWKLKKF